MKISTGVRKEVLTFLVITFGISTVFYTLIISARTLERAGTLSILGLMWCPGIAALPTLLINRRSLRRLGWGWGKTRYQALSFVLPIAYSLVAYGVVWLSGLGGISK